MARYRTNPVFSVPQAKRVGNLLSLPIAATSFEGERPGIVLFGVSTLVAAMEKTVSVTDANRSFSRLLRGVREGHSYVVTSRGRPVARIVPVGQDDKSRADARAALLARLRAEPVMDIGPWTRDELYEDE